MSKNIPVFPPLPISPLFPIFACSFLHDKTDMPCRRIIYALLTLSALLLLGVGRVCAQFHPVHASVVWASPRTPYLPDFYSGSRDRLVITLTNRDATQPVLHVRMRVRIRCGTGELRSREELPYPHIVLSTGIPHRITNTDLAAYLQPDRLTNAHILRNGQLPDGFTEISVQAVDLFTGKALSDWHTARSHLSVNKPPFLIAPERDATVALTEPTAILFRWQPRLATATEYEFTLKELPSTGESPQGAFPYGHVVHRETVRGTMLSYTHLHPPLIANRLYAWQIRAIQRDGIDEVSTYENGGYSEVSWFRLTDGCAAPTHLHAHPRYAKVELRWRDAPKAASYTIQIRPKTRLGIYEWQAFSNVSSPNTIRGLLPGRTYEWRVGASCTDIEPVYSEVEEFTLSTENEELLRDCGKVPEIPKGVSQEPHLAIKVGDVVITGGDYPLTITEIEPLGDGWYAGRGRTRLRTFVDMPVAMRFDSLRVNVDYRQIGGVVEAMSREESQFLLDADAVPMYALIKLNFTLPETPNFTFNPATGEIITIDYQGNPQAIQLEKPQNGSWNGVFPITTVDSDGYSFCLSMDNSDAEGDSLQIAQLIVNESTSDSLFNANIPVGPIAFRAWPEYDGEFGLDNAEVFTRAKVKRGDKIGFERPAIYNSYRYKGHVVDCFITVPVGKEIEIELDIPNRCDSCYVYEAVASDDNLYCQLIGNILKIRSDAPSESIKSYYLSVYRKIKKKDGDSKLLGVCEVQSLMPKEPYNIQLIYFRTDSTKVINDIDIAALKDKLNNHSFNQAFISFNINQKIDTFTCKCNAAELCNNPQKAMGYIVDSLRYIHESYIKQNDRTIVVVITNLQMGSTAGAVRKITNRGKEYMEPVVVIFKQSIKSRIYESVAHEIGHTLQLYDVHQDERLGPNPGKYLTPGGVGLLFPNYMNYRRPLKMFFRTQIQTMYNLDGLMPLKPINK